MITPSFPEAFVITLFAEALFGMLYNFLVAWAHAHKKWHVSVSVSGGVFWTLLIAGLLMYPFELPLWQDVLVLLTCFVCSGIPMAAGSMVRDEQQAKKESHKRRTWPTEAKKARDEAVMKLSDIAHAIAGKCKEKELSVTDLPAIVNDIHYVIGTLKSV